MTVKYRVNWSIWIGVMTGIYVLLYLMSPLAQYGIIWMSFIALPIYFNGGAKPEEYIHYALSSIAGVVWGLIFLFFIGVFADMGMSPAISNALGCGIFTIFCCFHMLVPDKVLLSKVPAMFGGIAATFSQGGEKILPIMITLVLGVTLGMICGLGTKFLKEDGSWGRS